MSQRLKLRSLIKKTADINNEIENEEFEHLVDKLEIVENESINCSGGDDILPLQTAITEINHTVFLNAIEAKESAVFNETEFANLLLNFIRDEDSDEFVWSKMDELWPKVFKTVIHSPSLFGTKDLEEVVVEEAPKQRRTQVKATQSTKIEPEKVKKFVIDEDKSLAIFYDKIVKCYKKNGSNPIPFYKLICDPNSFVLSVNNAFLCSFLIHNNLLKVYKTEDVTMVEPVDSNAPFTAKKGGDNNVHAVMSLDYEIWQNIISNYNVNSSMILEADQEQEREEESIAFTQQMDMF